MTEPMPKNPPPSSPAQSPLPAGWMQSTLGEILPVQYGKGLVGKTRNKRGEVPVYGSSGQVGVHDEALTKGPTLIIGRKGSVGSIHYSPVPCWPIDTTYFVEAVEGLDLKFFAAQLSFLGLVKFEKSTAIPGLSRNDYNAVRCVLPPENEQKRIVSKLDELFSQIDVNLEGIQVARQKVKAYRAATLSQAASGELSVSWREEPRAAGEPIEDAKVLLARILDERRVAWESEQRAKRDAPTKAQNKLPDDESWKSKYPTPTAPNMSTLPTLPDGWCWATVEQLASPEPKAITDGPFGSNLKSEHYTATGPRVIRLQNIGDGVFRDEYAHISEKHFEQLRKHEIFAGDVVIAALGERPPRSCLIPEAVGPAIVKADCIKFKTSPHVSAKYINFVLNAEPTRERTTTLLHGVGRPRLNLGEIKSITIPIPPLAEQEVIVSEVEQRLSAVAHTEASLNDNEKRAGAMRQTILKRAFAGDLVPSDPADEPAKVLWERIRAARTAAEAQEKEEKKLRPPQKRIMKLSNERKPLSVALSEAGGRLTPEDLFSAAGFTWETVDEFYSELREQIGHTIAQERPNPTDVYLVAQNGASPAVPSTSSGEAA